MPRPTERALKRRPKAVIMLTTNTPRDREPVVTASGKDFEWFTSDTAMQEYFDGNVTFHKEDTDAHDDMSYLVVEITDTEKMTVGRIDVKPETEITEKWLKAIEKDVTKAFYVEPTKSDTDDKPAVRARKKSTAAKSVAKKPAAAKKSETGDAPPKKRVAKKPASKPADA